MTNPSIENLRLELRRGSLVLAVLARLQTEQYGYELRKSLSENGLDIEESTLYPLVRRLEAQGLLASQWRIEDKREKRFYTTTEQGREVLERLRAEWKTISASLERIL
jgi:PadR family transcriptional regulator PadR